MNPQFKIEFYDEYVVVFDNKDNQYFIYNIHFNEIKDCILNCERVSDLRLTQMSMFVITSEGKIIKNRVTNSMLAKSFMSTNWLNF